jgi:hypothetical protein
LLLCLVREGQGIAAGVLESMGAGRERVRAAVLQVVTQGGEPPESELQTGEPVVPLLGELQRVLAVNHAQAVDDLTATILSLEVYEGGTLVHIRLRDTGADQPDARRRSRRQPQNIQLTDDIGTDYTLYTLQRVFFDEESSFFSARFSPGFGDRVHRLRVRIDSSHDPNEDPQAPESALNRASRNAEASVEPEPPHGLRQWEFDIAL